MRVVRETIFTEKEMGYLLNYVDVILDDVNYIATKHTLNQNSNLVSAIYIILDNAQELKKMLKGE